LLGVFLFSHTNIITSDPFDVAQYKHGEEKARAEGEKPETNMVIRRSIGSALESQNAGR
jgi:hypothetical protein